MGSATNGGRKGCSASAVWSNPGTGTLPGQCPVLAETCHSDERQIKRSGRGQQLLSYPEKDLLECGHHIGAQRACPASGTADVTRFRGANTEHGCLADGAFFQVDNR